jgi:glycerate 2-kinase
MDRKNDGLRLMDGAGYKKIIIACDSYKGCLSSREVNEAIASGVKEWNADDVAPEIITLEMSDGGEGMLDAFLSAMKGERVRIHAHDALMRWIEAEYGIVDDTATRIHHYCRTKRSWKKQTWPILFKCKSI